MTGLDKRERETERKRESFYEVKATPEKTFEQNNMSANVGKGEREREKMFVGDVRQDKKESEREREKMCVCFVRDRKKGS